MFKSTKNRRGAVLFLSSYIPLYIIIAFQNLLSIIKRCNLIITEKEITVIDLLKSKQIMIHGLIKLIQWRETYVIIIIIAFIFIIKRKLRKIIDFEEGTNNSKGVTIVDVKNTTHEYFINYFALYIFPFITLDLTSISGLFIFVFLLYIIGKIYINNELFYVNPTLNIIFKYNIYKGIFSYKDDDKEKSVDGVLLSKKDIHNLRLYRSINIIKLPLDGLYIERENNQNGGTNG